MRKLSTNTFQAGCIVFLLSLFVSQVVLSQIIIKDTINIQPSTIKPDFIAPPPPPEDTTTHSELLLVDSTTYDWKSIKPNFNPDSFQVKIDWNISVANLYDSQDSWSFDLSDSPRGIFSRLYQTVILFYRGTSTLGGSAIVASNYSRYAFQVGYGGFPADVRVNAIGDTAIFIFATNVSDYIQINGTLVLSLISTKKQLTIVNHQPWAIWPTLPPQINRNGTKESRGADRPGYAPNRTFSIQVLDAMGQPLENAAVTIKTEFISQSGGHGHSNGEIELPNELQGYFVGQGDHDNPIINLITDENGIAQVDSFTNHQVSGSYIITAFLQSDPTVKDTVHMMVRVPNLIDFGLVPTNKWNLTGTTSLEGMNHLSNHWCTQKMLDSLVAAAVEFYAWSGSEEGEGRNIVLGINDMSLEWGGMFDIKGDWNVPDTSSHSFHRVGLSVDIENTGFKGQDTKRPDNPKAKMLTPRGQTLRRILLQYGGKIYNERPIHFGFDGGR